MTKPLLFLFWLITANALGQSPANHGGKISSEELKTLVGNRDAFIPPGLKNETVCVVRYRPTRLREMERTAVINSFIKHGSDTSKVPPLGTKKSLKRYYRHAAKFSARHSEWLRQKLHEKGINAIIVDEDALQHSTTPTLRYWLKTVLVSTQESAEHVGWIMTVENNFYDLAANKEYEVFLPTNYHLWDLIE